MTWAPEMNLDLVAHFSHSNSIVWTLESTLLCTHVVDGPTIQ